MTIPDSPPEAKTRLQKEAEILRIQLSRLGNSVLKKVFNLSIEGSQWRRRILTVLFIVFGTILTMKAHPMAEWGNNLRAFFLYLFNPTYAQAAPHTLIFFVEFAMSALANPKTLKYLPVVILPFMIALQAAAVYLADIFELKRVGIAREFIIQVALTGNQKHIRISGGAVAEEHKDSPIFLIGGPGKALVELDSVAVFEKANGKPTVIGPSIRGLTTLEGFERIRQALDLRDQYTDALGVKSRSLDGIRVSTTDVRMVFSIWRNGQTPSAQSPHPFTKSAVEALVYGQASKVTPDGPNPSEPPSSWVDTVQNLIRSELCSFMSRQRLIEHLVSYGEREGTQTRQQEKTITDVSNTDATEDDSLEPRKMQPSPAFQSSHIVNNLFSQFADDFTEKANKHGIEMGWIGVGTWKTPNEIIPEKHLEAWRLSRENLARGNESELNSLHQEAQLQQTLLLIQNIPLARYLENKKAGKDHKHIVRDLLIAYREQLKEVTALLRKSRRNVPQEIDDAITYIENALGIIHGPWASRMRSTSGPPQPFPKFEPAAAGTSPKPVPSSPSSYTTGVPSTPLASAEEQALYQELYNITNHDLDRVERLIDHERSRAPHASRVELIQRAIESYLQNDRK